MQLKRTQEKCELDKRTHIPYLISGDCPKCHRRVADDLSSGSYLSYPVVGSTIRYGLYCAICGHEWSVNLKFDVTLDLVED